MNLPILISLCSLSISVITLYRTQFRKPKIVTRLGPDIHLYHPVDGGSAIYLPFLFSNESPTRGAIFQIFLCIKTPDGKRYFLKWLEEAEIALRTWNYSHLNRAKPFTVDGYSTVSKVYWFDQPNGAPILSFSAGKYTITAYIWTRTSPKPNIIAEDRVILGEDAEKTLKKRLKEKNSKTLFFYFEKNKIISIVNHDKESKLPWDENQLRP